MVEFGQVPEQAKEKIMALGGEWDDQKGEWFVPLHAVQAAELVGMDHRPYRDSDYCGMCGEVRAASLYCPACGCRY